MFMRTLPINNPFAKKNQYLDPFHPIRLYSLLGLKPQLDGEGHDLGIVLDR